MGMTDTRAVEGYAGYSGRLHVCAACIIIYDRVTGDIDFRAARKNDVEKDDDLEVSASMFTNLISPLNLAGPLHLNMKSAVKIRERNAYIREYVLKRTGAEDSRHPVFPNADIAAKALMELELKGASMAVIARMQSEIANTVKRYQGLAVLDRKRMGDAVKGVLDYYEKLKGMIPEVSVVPKKAYALIRRNKAGDYSVWMITESSAFAVSKKRQFEDLSGCKKKVNAANTWCKANGRDPMSMPDTFFDLFKISKAVYKAYTDATCGGRYDICEIEQIDFYKK